MASDEKYAMYINTAIRSIRKYNQHIPIDVYSCAKIDSRLDNKLNCKVHSVEVPGVLMETLTDEGLEHASTRVAKLESMMQKTSETMLYADSDILVYENPEKLNEELKVKDSDKPVVYMLLKRPHLLSIAQIGWLYFKNVADKSPQQIADLVNDTFSVDYSADRLQNIRCWNGGMVYGATEGVNALAGLWKENYLKMLTGKNKDSYIPNDQLCLWLAVDKLDTDLTIRELPLAWNFMPGHAMEEIMNQTNPKLEDIKKSLTGVKILHFAQNKNDKWVQVLIDEVNLNKK